MAGLGRHRGGLAASPAHDPLVRVSAPFVSRLRHLSHLSPLDPMLDFSSPRPGKKQKSSPSSLHLRHPLLRLLAPERLEERAVLYASNLLGDNVLSPAFHTDPVFAPGTSPELVAQYEN